MATNYRRVLNRDSNDIFVATVLLTGPHAAIIYRSSDGRPRRLHLAGLGHCASVDEDRAFAHDGHICVGTNLQRDDAVALAGYCRRIYKANARHRQIPYNLRYDPGTRFDPDTGELVLGETATGLTCATFVVHVFSSSANPILDGSGWPSRQKDLVRQRFLVESMRPNYPVQASLIEQEIGCPRIRPEEVVGACLEEDLPADFDRCEANGYFVAGLLQASKERLFLRENAS